MVERQLPKLHTRVRFPSPAPSITLVTSICSTMPKSLSPCRRPFPGDAHCGRVPVRSMVGAHRQTSDKRAGHLPAERGRNAMNRIALAALAASTVLLAGTAMAQQQVDWDKIQIKTTDLGNKTYMLEGQGGNITVAVGTDGIIMVDGQFAPLSDKIQAAIKATSPLPIKYMINTHFHGAHTGGNDSFAKDGVTIVAHDNIRLRLAAGTTAGLTGNKTPPRAAEALPKETYFGGTKTVEVGGRKALL